MLTKEVTLLVRDLLVDNWDSDKTSNITPRIHTGWFNKSWKEPQITITDPTEVPIAGGNTGFRAVDSEGSGVKLMLGAVNVGAWGHDEDGSNLNPLDLTFILSQEIKRIINHNPYPGFGLMLLTWISRTKAVDPGSDPILFTYNNEVRYIYEDRVE